FVKSNASNLHIRSVAEFPCGEWNVHCFLAWYNFLRMGSYLGIDTRHEHVVHNYQAYAIANLSFVKADDSWCERPSIFPNADLWIVWHTPNDQALIGRLINALYTCKTLKYLVIVRDNTLLQNAHQFVAQ